MNPVEAMLCFLIGSVLVCAATFLPTGCETGQEIMRRDLAKSGHAIYVTDKKTGTATWQLLPPATQPK